MPDQPARPGSAGVYERPARRVPWGLVAAGVALSAGLTALVLWLT